MSNKKSLPSRLQSRLAAAVPDKRIEQEMLKDIHLFIGEVRNLLNENFEKTFKSIEVHNSKIDQLAEVVETLSQKVSSVRTITAKTYDHIFELRKQLVDVRKTDEYKEIFNQKDPLVTVRIATYNNSELLVQRAIKSVQDQTYNNWEIVVVGDGCDEKTQIAIDELHDNRIKYFNFPYRNVYPEDPISRWQVAGSPGMNKAVELAKGTWIAPLDDDDEFAPNHIEVLLNKALSEKFEFVHGAFKQVIVETGEESVIKSYPAQVNFAPAQAGIYTRILDFFEWDTQCWVINEPGDWNFIRRMMEAGVFMGFVEDCVTTMYTYKPGSKK
ncbi:MAG: glycosyltransferase family 2 protein [Acidimicrobiia bacterium]